MSKNNVNPDYYKVAGRERQGENILQERHKQAHAELRARERFELRASTPPRIEARDAADSSESEPATSAPKAKPKAARASKSTTKKATTKKSTTKSRTPVKSQSNKKTSKKKKPTTRAKATSTATKRAASASRAKQGGAQASGKRGKRSTAQKRASSRNDFGSMPATRPVAGAFGKRPSARRRKPS